MTDTTSTPPPPTENPPPLRRAHEAALFRWSRGLGVVRADGWVGGVCGGIAGRFGIDPLIVRGVFVVATLVGLPAVIAYLVCWILLPDVRGRIPLQRLGRTSLGPVAITLGVIAVVVFGLLFAAASWRSGSDLAWLLLGGWGWQVLGLSGFGQFVTMVLWAVLAVGVIMIITKIAVTGRSVPGHAATPVAPGPADVSGTSAENRDAAPATGVSPAPRAEGAASDPSGEDVAAWRIQQEEWRRQHDDWRQLQAGADAAAKEQARRDREEQGRAFAAAAQERRETRRRTRPRTPALFVVGVVGAALVGSALTVIAVADLGAMVASGAALLVAGIVCATGMTVAGILRRRSGFLAFLASVSLASGLIVGYTGILLPDGPMPTFATGPAQMHRQASGFTTVTVNPVHPGDGSGTFTLQKAGGGDTVLTVLPGAALSLDTTLGDGDLVIETTPADGGTVSSTEVQPVGRTASGTRYAWSGSTRVDHAVPAETAHVRIDQANGNVRVEILEDAK